MTSTPGWRSRTAATYASDGSTAVTRSAPSGELRGQRAGAASDVEDPAAERESGEIGEGLRQRLRVAPYESVIGIGIAQAHFFSFKRSLRRPPTWPSIMKPMPHRDNHGAMLHDASHYLR